MELFLFVDENLIKTLEINKSTIDFSVCLLMSKFLSVVCAFDFRSLKGIYKG